MFECFTGRARHVVVLAQEEARSLRHNYIGTEHLLLGLLNESDGVAHQALDRLGVRLDAARERVVAEVGEGRKPASGGHIPFTPRSKKVLELALREALRFGHGYIGTEHLLLGLVREGDGVGARVLGELAGGLRSVRMAVLDVMPKAEPTEEGRRWLRRVRERLRPEPAAGAETGPVTRAAESTLAAARRLAGADPIGTHHLLVAALGDAESAAARALGSLGVDLERVRAALRDADTSGTSDETPAVAGRRGMLLRADAGRLTVEATDRVLLDKAAGALTALGRPDSIAGTLPAAASLSGVWEAIAASLDDIRARAGSPPPAGEGSDVGGHEREGTEGAGGPHAEAG